MPPSSVGKAILNLGLQKKQKEAASSEICVINLAAMDPLQGNLHLGTYQVSPALLLSHLG